MKAYAITIHPVEVLNDGFGIRQITRTIWALATKQLADKAFILFAVNFDWPVLTNFATQFVKEHADQLVRHIGLRPPRSSP
jgi:hypothetical protein